MNDYMKQKTLILFGIVCVCIVLLVGIALVTKQKNATGPKRVSNTSSSPRAATSLSAISSKDTVATNETFTVTINLASGENLVNGVQLELGYDPKTFAITKVEQGDFFKNPILLNNSNNISEGSILFAMGSVDAKKGNGTIATLTVVSIKKTNGKVEVLTIKPTSLISEFDNKQSVLKDVKGASIVVR